ncbi:MAG: metal-dependent hydrolase [Candidatus Aminicenantes bacterium]|nr:metal-dependent hydrolase [Candidatus Aminicenantes bacterium]
MNPVTHLLIGWLVANSAELDRKERILVTTAGIIPDIDGFGFAVEILTKNWEKPLLWYSKYHHVISHNLGFAFFFSLLCFCLTKQRWKTAGLAFLSFHLHLLGDLVGARGPDGFQWPLSYLLPFSDRLQLTWAGQWELNAWPNILITLAALFITFYLA